MIQITEEHYEDLKSNAVYRNEFAKFLVNLFCLGIGVFAGTMIGFGLATLLYMSL